MSLDHNVTEKNIVVSSNLRLEKPEARSNLRGVIQLSLEYDKKLLDLIRREDLEVFSNSVPVNLSVDESVSKPADVASVSLYNTLAQSVATSMGAIYTAEPQIFAGVSKHIFTGDKFGLYFAEQNEVLKSMESQGLVKLKEGLDPNISLEKCLFARGLFTLANANQK